MNKVIETALLPLALFPGTNAWLNHHQEMKFNRQMRASGSTAYPVSSPREARHEGFWDGITQLLTPSGYELGQYADKEEQPIGVSVGAIIDTIGMGILCLTPALLPNLYAQIPGPNDLVKMSLLLGPGERLVSQSLINLGYIAAEIKDSISYGQRLRRQKRSARRYN